MDRQQQSRWRPNRTQVTWIGIGGVAVLFAAIVVFGGYYFEWKWTGYPKRTPWDWVDLLIVPFVLALGGYLFTRAENLRTQRIADERRQDDTLQAYLDGIAQLLTDKDRPLHRAQLGDSLSTVARARTLTVLTRLEGGRKRSVVRFLYESGLITKERHIVNLSRADLDGADLHAITLSRAALDGASMRGADLSNSVLTGADLRNTVLIQANLYGSYLQEANLEGADLEGANLTWSNLRGAYLTWSRLRGTALANANLTEIQGITNVELEQQAETLEEATMPHSQKYEDWLKSKGRGENGENSSPSF